MLKLLAIDPGMEGGMAWIDQDGLIVCQAMPDGMTSQADLVREVVTECGIKSCVLELVGGYRPGNSGPAAATFARHCGHLEAILYCYGVSTTQVLPKRWMSFFGSLPADKIKRKNKIKELMARKYPNLKVTLKVSDALAILTSRLGGVS